MYVYVFYMLQSMVNNGQRIASNTILLYFRSIIVMLLSIYTSRVLLRVLGVEDYGIYNIVGGIVALFLSIKSVFAASVQRFLNFEKGKGNIDNVSRIFSTSIVIHIFIAIIFVLLVEIFGYIYIPSKMNLPDGKLDTAMMVFHCSVFTTAVSILTIPHDAVIISNERMNFYAWISIADTVLKLLIVYIVPVLPFQYLSTYAVLILIASLIIRIVTVLYTRQFTECRNLKFVYNGYKKNIKIISSFAGWNFFGCCASSIIEEGSNLIINVFGGVAANAARGVSYQIRNAITSLSSNIVTASQPFIMQSAATTDKFIIWNHLFKQAKLVFFMVAIIAFPVFVYAEEILNLWLDNVPIYSVEFSRAVLVYLLIMSFQKSLDLAFKTYDKLPIYQIIDASVLLLGLPFIYFSLKTGSPLYMAFIILAIFRLVDYVVIILLAKIQLQLQIQEMFIKVVCPVLLTSIIFIAISYLFSLYFMPSNSLFLILYVLLMILVLILSLYFIVFSKSEKIIARNLLCYLLKIKK